MPVSEQEAAIKRALRDRPEGERSVTWLARAVGANRSAFHRRLRAGALSQREREAVARVLGIAVPPFGASDGATAPLIDHGALGGEVGAARAVPLSFTEHVLFTAGRIAELAHGIARAAERQLEHTTDLGQRGHAALEAEAKAAMEAAAIADEAVAAQDAMAANRARQQQGARSSSGRSTGRRRSAGG